MSLSEFKHLYLAGGLLMLAGAVALLVGEFMAIFNGQRGDTITEIVRAYHVPSVVFYLLGFALIGFVIWLIRHFPGVEGL